MHRVSAWEVWRDNLTWFAVEARHRVGAAGDLVRHFVRARGSWSRMQANVDAEHAAVRAAVEAGISLDLLDEVEESFRGHRFD